MVKALEVMGFLDFQIIVLLGRSFLLLSSPYSTSENNENIK